MLKCLIYGEIGTIIGNGFLFGVFDGLIQFCAMYINYAAFASMNPCQVLVVGFIGSWEVGISILEATGKGEDYLAINETLLSKVTFYTMIAFACIKILCALKIHKELKRL